MRSLFCLAFKRGATGQLQVPKKSAPDAVTAQEVEEGVVALEGAQRPIAPAGHRVLPCHLVTEPELHPHA